MSVDYASCDACSEAVDKNSSVTWTKRISPPEVAYRHPDCYDPWAEEGAPVPDWTRVDSLMAAAYEKPLDPTAFGYEMEVRTVSSTGGEKGVKPARFDLVPVGPLTTVAKLYAKGATKYDDHNWARGYEWSKSYAALMRHATQFWGGEDLDADTGLPHMASVVFHALALIEFMENHRQFDDRPTTTREM